MWVAPKPVHLSGVWSGPPNRRAGLRVLLVVTDTSERADLNTFVSDRDLQGTPLLDDRGEMARAHRVTELPTTLLRSGGRVVARWENVTRPAELAFAVRRALDSP